MLSPSGMTEQIFDNIYRIFVPLPNNPLKNLNAYLIKGERNLLIDTGFNSEVCYEALTGGLKELGASPENTDIFLTHLHADHAGLAYRLQREGTKVYVSDADRKYLLVDRLEAQWNAWDALFLPEGFPQKELDEMPKTNAARAYAPSKDCDFTSAFDGDVLSYGGHKLLCVSAPGHSPGLMCLYIEKEKTMFLSDHVLFDITPNITAWMDMENPLGVYLDNLERFKLGRFETTRPLPAHRSVSKTMRERIDEIIAHHHARLAEALNIVLAREGQCAYEIASQMTWSIRAKNWGDFPVPQKWFAVGEAMAHLRWLEDSGAAVRVMEGGVYRYFKNSSAAFVPF